MKSRLFTLALLCLISTGLLSGCGAPSAPVTPAAKESAAPAPAAETPAAVPTPAAPPKAEPAVSPTATQNDAKLNAGAVTATLPADHWLVGTSNVPDMVPATVEEPAARQLIAEEGPAYLERCGRLRVLHLKGTPYEMGLQHGKLMKDEILQAAAILKIAGNVSLKEKYQTSLRDAWNQASPFIPEKYKEEIKGMAEAIGVPIEEVQDLTIFPELFHCSGFAYWGKATADGALLHGRVLDYMRDAGLDAFALVIVTEPKDGRPVVNVAYSGMIGSVTGMNADHVSMGEMGGRGEGRWAGMPMSILLREILESCQSIEQACQFMQRTPRTCEYYYVISDSKANNGIGAAVGVAATPEMVQFIQPNQAVPQLPRPFEDAVLMSAGDRYDCLAGRTEKQYGKITPQIALDIMARGVAMKSNMHDALFKPATLELWVTNSTVEQPACNLPYTHLDMSQLLKERPTK